jgi:hypothetical protein
MLYMFWNILVHHQEQLYKLYIAFGTCRHIANVHILNGLKIVNTNIFIGDIHIDPHLF